jgi:hypothetical protein
VRLRTIVAGSVVVVVASSILATAGVAAARSASGAPVGELRDCRSRGEGRTPQRLPPQPGVRIGPLLFWPSIKSKLSSTGNGTEWPYVQKAPVILPARTKLVLAIAPEARGTAAFQHRGRFVTAVRFEACREREPAFAYRGTVGRYTGFPFAVGLSTRSACVPMEVWVDGRDEPVRRVVPVGRSSC